MRGSRDSHGLRLLERNCSVDEGMPFVLLTLKLILLLFSRCSFGLWRIEDGGLLFSITDGASSLLDANAALIP